jgi:hypothetical protein
MGVEVVRGEVGPCEPVAGNGRGVGDEIDLMADSRWADVIATGLIAFSLPKIAFATCRAIATLKPSTRPVAGSR